MSGFVQWLEDINSRDSKAKAVLRRSLTFDPGDYVQAYPYVEPFLKNSDDRWRRVAHYLLAALWAEHWRAERVGKGMSIAEACAAYQRDKGSDSTERRFINLLDSDADQLPHRMRQMVALLKDYPIDFDDLLKGLLYWEGPRKETQKKWAREFYRCLLKDMDTPTTTQQED